MKSRTPMALPMLAAALFTLTAQAQSQTPELNTPWFAEVGYTALTFKGQDDAGLSGKAKPGVLTVAGGYRVHPNIALESVVGLGINKADIVVNGENNGATAKVSYLGLFVRPSWEVSKGVEIFGRVGYALTRVEAAGPLGSASDSEGSLALGLGLNVAVTPQSYIQATWTQPYKKDGLRAAGFGLAYGMKF